LRHGGAGLTFTGTTRGPDGTDYAKRETIEFKSADEHVWSAYATGPDGKELETTTLTYTRAAAK
jgi:hypothetical protein